MSYANNRLLIIVGPTKNNPKEKIIVRIKGAFDATFVNRSTLY